MPSIRGNDLLFRLPCGSQPEIQVPIVIRIEECSDLAWVTAEQLMFAWQGAQFNVVLGTGEELCDEVQRHKSIDLAFHWAHAWPPGTCSIAAPFTSSIRPVPTLTHSFRVAFRPPAT